MGNYEISFIGFPYQRKMVVENSIVHYSYMQVAIHIIVDDRTHQIITEGVENVGLIIPFNFGPGNC